MATKEATEQDLPHRPAMEQIATGFRTKSDKIRALATAGYSRAEIARHLDIRYQHVRNVLVDDERLAKANEPNPRLSDADNPARSAKRLDPSKSRVDADGRVAIPPDFLQSLGLKENDTVILTVEEDAIRLMSLPAAIRRAQAFVRQFVPADVSLVDELLAERRPEAAMTRDEAIASLKDRADAVRALGATSLYLFGSAARDQARIGSDLDLFIDYDPNRKFSLVDLVGIKLFLEDELGIVVDVTTRDSLHPMLRRDIENSAVRVF